MASEWELHPRRQIKFLSLEWFLFLGDAWRRGFMGIGWSKKVFRYCYLVSHSHSTYLYLWNTIGIHIKRLPWRWVSRFSQLTESKIKLTLNWQSQKQLKKTKQKHPDFMPLSAPRLPNFLEVLFCKFRPELKVWFNTGSLSAWWGSEFAFLP